MKKWLLRILMLLFIICFIISTIYILKNVSEDRKQKEIFNELENFIIQEQTDNIEEQKEEKSEVNLQKLYEMNNDFVGWLKIDDTNINYPVMQTEVTRKDYYLNRNFYKEYSGIGTPYIAETCNILTSDNIIIYGHHIQNKQIFGELEKYKKQEFYETHNIINFDTIYGSTEYEIIAVFKTVAYTGFEYYKFINSNTKEEFDTFIRKCKELSFYETGKSAEYGDKLITLSTCEYSNTNGRFVVVARKITSRSEEE